MAGRSDSFASRCEAERGEAALPSTSTTAQSKSNNPRPFSGLGTDPFYFNGGLIKARQYNWPYSTNSLEKTIAFSASQPAYVTRRAFFDTNGRTCNIGIRTPTLRHCGDAATDGGLTKNGTGHVDSHGHQHVHGDDHGELGHLTCATNGEMRIVLNRDFTCNKIQGTGSVNFNGLFRIAPVSNPSVFGDWKLVDVSTLETFNTSTFGLALTDGTEFINKGNGLYTSGGWRFSTATGILTTTSTQPPSQSANVRILVISALARS